MQESFNIRPLCARVQCGRWARRLRRHLDVPPLEIWIVYCCFEAQSTKGKPKDQRENQNLTSDI